MFIPATFDSLPDILVRRLVQNLSKKEVACLRVQHRYYTLLTPDVSYLIAASAIKECIETQQDFNTLNAFSLEFRNSVTALRLHKLTLKTVELQTISSLFPYLRSLRLSECAIWECSMFEEYESIWDLGHLKKKRIRTEVKFSNVRNFSLKSLKSDCKPLDWLSDELEELKLKHWGFESSNFSMTDLQKFTQLQRLALGCRELAEEHLVNLPPSLVALELSLSNVTQMGTQALNHLTRLQSLILKISNQMPPFKVLPSNVTGLNIYSKGLGDENLDLNHLTQLRTLLISGDNYFIKGIALQTFSQHLLELDLQRCDITDDNFVFFKRFSQLSALNIRSNKKITGASFQALFTSLKKLNVSDCNVGDEDLAKLAHCTHLQELIMNENKRISGAYFDRLPPSLIALDANYCRVREKHLAKLTPLSCLQTLDLSGNQQVLGTNFQFLPRSLKALRLNHCHVIDDSISQLSRLIFLEKLDLSSNSEIAGGAFECLPTSLIELRFNFCDNGIGLTDEDLGCLSHLTRLKKLYLHRLKKVHGSTFSLLPTSLVELDCYECKINPENFLQLTHLTNLRKLAVEKEVETLGTIMYLKTVHPKLVPGYISSIF